MKLVEFIWLRSDSDRHVWVAPFQTWDYWNLGAVDEGTPPHAYKLFENCLSVFFSVLVIGEMENHVGTELVKCPWDINWIQHFKDKLCQIRFRQFHFAFGIIFYIFFFPVLEKFDIKWWLLPFNGSCFFIIIIISVTLKCHSCHKTSFNFFMSSLLSRASQVSQVTETQIFKFPKSTLPRWKVRRSFLVHINSRFELQHSLQQL